MSAGCPGAMRCAGCVKALPLALVDDLVAKVSTDIHNEPMGKYVEFPVTGGGMHVCNPVCVALPGFEEIGSESFVRGG